MKPMLATAWDGEDPTGWFLSEKLDGLRAVWTGSELLSREGHPFRAPAWFIDGLPAGVALDGELYGGPGTLAKVSGMFRRNEPRDADWRSVKLHVYDSPLARGGIAAREELYRSILAGDSVVAVEHVRCCSLDHLAGFAGGIIARGGEGVMLRHPSAAYQPGRSKSLLKFKPSEFLHHALMVNSAVVA